MNPDQVSFAMLMTAVVLGLLVLGVVGAVEHTRRAKR